MPKFDRLETKARLKAIKGTMAGLARKSGVPYNSINHYMQGYRKPIPANLVKITQTLESMENDFATKGLRALKVSMK